MKENKTLEFKSDMTNSFLKTVSAYANYGSGAIEFGRRDDGSIQGIKNPTQFCIDVETKINDSIHPKPDYSLEVDRKNKLVILSVNEGRYKPYLYKGKAYRRSDTASVEVDQMELKRLTLEGSNLYFEDLPCEDKALSFTILESKLVEKLGISKLTDDMLRTFGFFSKEKKYNIAASLFADKNSFPGIDYAVFGKSINEILDRNTFSGCSVLKQYDDIISVFRRNYKYEQIVGMERQEIERIPEAAFREAIANALVHRTWDINSHIKISMFEDKIEIASPGGLPKGLTKEEYLRGNISNLRNPIIGNLFFRMNYIEMFGTGIRRINETYADYANKPIFEIFDNSVLVTLPTTTTDYKATNDEKKLLTLLYKGIILSRTEIAEALGWSKDKTIRTLNGLKKSGYIESHGSGRSTRYKRH